MNTTTKRPALPIQHTPELEDAAIAVVKATNATGQSISLCSNPLDVNGVRTALVTMVRSFEDPAFFYDDPTPGTEITAVDHIVLLATLLREHLRAAQGLMSPPINQRGELTW